MSEDQMCCDGCGNGAGTILTVFPKRSKRMVMCQRCLSAAAKEFVNRRRNLSTVQIAKGAEHVLTQR